MTKLNNVIGKKFITNEGYKVEIIEYISYKQVLILFDSGYKAYVNMGALKKGNIRNPYHPSLRGIGFLGEGKYMSKINKKPSKCYTVWRSMFDRCYSNYYQKNQPTYIGCTIVEEWHNFQNFGEWFEKNYVDGWHLDKDIICKDCKIYSPDTCAFVPVEINNLFTNIKNVKNNSFTGVQKSYSKYRVDIRKNKVVKYLGTFNTPEEAFQAYKTAKESHIKEVANKWKDLIDFRIYKAMYEYKVDNSI